MKTLRNILLVAAIFGLMQSGSSVMACPACYGQSDSPMAHGMNAGILTLLAVISVVLCGAATFFVVLARRAAAVARKETAKA